MASPIDKYIDRTKNPQWQDRRLLASIDAAKKKAKDAVAAAPDLYGGPRVQDAIADAKAKTKEAQAAAAPPDTYGAMLRELARSRTQMMLRDTNGQAGSVLGIGTDNYAGPQGASNQRITADNRYAVQPMRSATDNYRVARFARLTRSM